MNLASSSTRRDFLWHTGGGLGGVALAQMLFAESPAKPQVAGFEGLHHRPKARRVIQLFMNGGASPMDTFDFKPKLAQIEGKKFDPGGDVKLESVTNSPGFKVLPSPHQFRQYGQCGRWVSSVFPHLAGCVDDLAFIMSMVSKTNVHGPASYMQNTGFTQPGFPAMGAWISYALGNLSDNLPTFVVLPDARGLPYNNQGNFSSAFLPVQHQGVIIRPHLPTPISDLRPPSTAKFITPQEESASLDLLKKMNREHEQQHPGDSRLEARIISYELAAKMQLSAPEALDVRRETEQTHRLYGINEKTTENFGRNCLIARRLIERGVRYVQVWSGAGGPTGNWDNHGNIKTELPAIAVTVDKPIAGLLRDLKARGLLEDTLVIWTTEFGRMPFSQGVAGRDHNMGTFVTWLAGAGVKPGVAHGQSDEWGWRALTPIYCYDLHATILHLLGIDHKRLTVRHNGIDRRLTDVHGEVIKEVLA
ncbi:MAG TPA: DUF1501 domain-containing protein [Gemmataceae bacterium]|nr:DUF1501 domain-containing protein [Gemmataceae bacterium]